MMMYGWIIVLVIIILGIILYAGKNGNKAIKPETPEDILDKRNARGEITKEEYLEQKKALKSEK